MTGTTTTWPHLTAAHDALRAAVDGVPADAWHRPTPCEQWDVTQVVQHAAGDQLAYAAKLTDGPGPTDDPFSPSGTLDGDASELLEPALSASRSAFAAVGPDDEQVPVPLPPFTLPAVHAVAAAALDAAVHAWDIAVATGQASPLTPQLARALRPTADLLADPLRGFAYGPPIPTPADADAATSLLGYLGRTAAWAPPTGT